jgi:hypothetical protein
MNQATGPGRARDDDLAVIPEVAVTMRDNGAVADAVFHATGRRVGSLPITIDQLL